MNNPQFPTARKSGLVVQEVPDEVLVFDLESNKAHCLNRTASLVWKSCDGKTSVTNIADFVGKQTGEKVSDDVVWLAIDQLSENRLLESEVKSTFTGISRREVVKRIGLASAVALPIVASLVAPQNALANVSCVCLTSLDCGFPGFETCTSLVCCNMAGLCAPEIPGDPGCAPPLPTPFG